MQSLQVISTLILASLFIQTAVNGNEKRENGTLPTIFIVGAQKGGTSSLFGLMIRHPLLCGGERKESQIFNHDVDYYRGFDYFKRGFRNEKCFNNPEAHFIDGSPIMDYQFIWDRIKSIYKNNLSMRDSLKFIALLREPVSRDVSWYKHHTKTEARDGQIFRDVKTMNESSLGNYSYIPSFFSRGM
jgi:hypothetical protein